MKSEVSVHDLGFTHSRHGAVGLLLHVSVGLFYFRKHCVENIGNRLKTHILVLS